MSVAASNRPQEQSPLWAWRLAHGVSREAFAEMVGAGRKTVQYWDRGQTVPSLVFAFLIERATEGGVPVACWLGLNVAKEEMAKIKRTARSRKYHYYKEY